MVAAQELPRNCPGLSKSHISRCPVVPSPSAHSAVEGVLSEAVFGFWHALGSDDRNFIGWHPFIIACAPC